MASAIVTDSASALTPAVCAKLDLELVQLRVMFEGRDLPDCSVDRASLYAALRSGVPVTTSQPSPGDFARAYDAALAHGIPATWSIHVGSAVSGTLNAARIAAAATKLDVRLVDTGLASMAEGLCVVAAVAAVRAAPGADVPAVVNEASAAQENVFFSLTPELLATSGRGEVAVESAGMPVLALTAGAGVAEVGRARDLDEAIDTIARRVKSSRSLGVVAVGGGGTPEATEELCRRVVALRGERRVVRYEVPASIAAHTGPTLGVIISSVDLPVWAIDALRG
ncbi:MAG: DegV family protein [Candidatus Dormibacteria bacterium]